jgi:endonuclease/exonuclease/phosphatase family metal-dependent hydrolase
MVPRFLATVLLAAGWLLLPSLGQCETLRILTYNIHHGEGTDGVFDLNRIAGIISAANPDIVALQEVDNGVPRTNNVNEVAQLAQLTGMQSYFAKAINLNGGTYGDGVLLRQGISIVSSQSFALPNPDNTEARQVAQLGLSLDSNPATAEINLFATHLAHDSPAGRQQSATFINNLVSSSTVPSILAGDMNANPGSTAFNILDNQWTDATNVANSGKNRDNQIDYVFYRSTLQWNVTTAGQFILNATTNVASDHDPLLAVLDLPNVWPGNALVWNNNTGVATAVTDGFATGNGSAGVGDFPASPWIDAYNTGKQNLFIGYNGNATVSGNSTRTIGSLHIGTNQASAFIAGRNGNGTLTASGALGMVVSSTADTPGDLYVGEGGQTGTMNWNGTGTLEVQGKLRVGQGGTGTFNQAGGVVIAGNIAGSLKFVAVGVNPGSNGTYNLNGGILRPSGGFAGTEFRQILVGDDSATGTLNVGDDVGTAASAAIESNDDLIVGRGGGTGTLYVRSDGRIDLRSTPTNEAEFHLGESGTGTVVQTGGTVTSDALFRIGGGSTGVATYTISGGTLATGTDGVAPFQIARTGATATLRVSGTATVTHGAEMIIADDTNTGSNGRLELIGSQATFHIGQLDNVSGGANGMRETVRWQADAGGVTPIAITGPGALTSNRVRLQSASELAADTGTGASLTGDGVSLELDLSAITTSRILTLINNQTSDLIQGFFEKGTSTSLYAEGAAILGTGFNGTVNISYIGGTGNDVVLNLVAATIPGDFNADGSVDTRDYIVWRKTNSANSQAYLDWRANFGASTGAGQAVAAAVPEPAAIWLTSPTPAASQSRLWPLSRTLNRPFLADCGELPGFS